MLIGEPPVSASGGRDRGAQIPSHLGRYFASVVFVPVAVRSASRRMWSRRQRAPGLAAVAPVRLGHRAGGRRTPKRAVVGLAVGVGAHPEAERKDQHGQRRREGGGHGEGGVEGLRPYRAIIRDARRVERRAVGGDVVVGLRVGQRQPPSLPSGGEGTGGRRQVVAGPPGDPQGPPRSLAGGP